MPKKKFPKRHRNEELIKLLGDGVPDEDMNKVEDKLKYDKRLEDFRRIHRAGMERDRRKPQDTLLRGIPFDKMDPRRDMKNKILDYQKQDITKRSREVSNLISKLESEGEFRVAEYFRGIVSLSKKLDEPFFGEKDGRFYAIYLKSSMPGNNFPKKGSNIAKNGKAINLFKKTAKKVTLTLKGSNTLKEIKKWIDRINPDEFYSSWKTDTADYPDDSVDIWYRKGDKDRTTDKEKDKARMDKALNFVSKPLHKLGNSTIDAIKKLSKKFDLTYNEKSSLENSFRLFFDGVVEKGFRVIQ